MKKELLFAKKPYVFLLVLLGMIFQYLRISTLPRAIFTELSPSVYIPYLVTMLIIIPFVTLVIFLIPLFLALEIITHIPLTQTYSLPTFKKIVYIHKKTSQYRKHHHHYTVMRC